MTESTSELIDRYFYRPEMQQLSKQKRLQQSILDAIADSKLKSGNKMPPEVNLAKFLGISLGTAQKALGELARHGILTRNPGKGTFIAEGRIQEDALWHFRFLNSEFDEKYLPIFTKTLGVRKISQKSHLMQVFSGYRGGYVEITRLIHIADNAVCLSRLYLKDIRFGALANEPIQDTDFSNIKQLLRSNYGVSNRSVDQSIRFTKFDANDAQILGCGDKEVGITLEVYAYEGDGSITYYNKLLIPPNQTILDMSFSGAPVKLGRFSNSTTRA